jgi:hypothetical protein
MASYKLKDGATLSDDEIEDIATRFEAGDCPGRSTEVILRRPRVDREVSKNVSVSGSVGDDAVEK